MWEASLIHMPVVTMIQNLVRMTALNLFERDSQAITLVVNRLFE